MKLLALLSLAIATQAHAAILYSTGAGIYAADTGAQVASVPNAVDLFTLASGSNSDLYALDYRGGDTMGGFDIRLVTISRSYQQVSSVPVSYLGTPVFLAEGLAVSPSGALWVAFRYGAITGSPIRWDWSAWLGTVNPATGVIAPASVIALSGPFDLDADMMTFVGDTLIMGDNLWGVGTTLYHVDLTSGALTLIGPIADAAGALQAYDLAWDGVTLWAEAGQERISVDPATGWATVVGPGTDGGITWVPDPQHDCGNNKRTTDKGHPCAK